MKRPHSPRTPLFLTLFCLSAWSGLTGAQLPEWGPPIMLSWPHAYVQEVEGPRTQFGARALGGGITYTMEKLTRGEWYTVTNIVDSDGQVRASNPLQLSGTYRFRAENSYGFDYSEPFEIRKPTQAPRILSQPIFHIMLAGNSNHAITFPGLRFHTSDRAQECAFYELHADGSRTYLRTSWMPVFQLTSPRTMTLQAEFRNSIGKTVSTPIEILALDSFQAPLRILEQETQVITGRNLFLTLNRPGGIQDFTVYKRASVEGEADEAQTVIVEAIDDTSSKVGIRFPDPNGSYYILHGEKEIPLKPFVILPKPVPTLSPNWAVDEILIYPPCKWISLPLIFDETIQDGDGWRCVITGKGADQPTTHYPYFLKGSGLVIAQVLSTSFEYPEGTIQFRSKEDPSIITEPIPYRLVLATPPLVRFNQQSVSGIAGVESMINIHIEGDWDTVVLQQSSDQVEWTPLPTDYIYEDIWSYIPEVTTQVNWLRAVVENEYGTTISDPIPYQPVLHELPQALGAVNLVDAQAGIFHSFVYGNFRMHGYPYLYFDSIGLVKVHGDESGSIWMSKWGESAHQWIYSGVDAYPYTYNAGTGTWLKISEEAPGWGYNLTTGQWEELD